MGGTIRMYRPLGSRRMTSSSLRTSDLNRHHMGLLQSHPGRAYQQQAEHRRDREEREGVGDQDAGDVTGKEQRLEARDEVAGREHVREEPYRGGHAVDLEDEAREQERRQERRDQRRL